VQDKALRSCRDYLRKLFLKHIRTTSHSHYMKRSETELWA